MDRWSGRPTPVRAPALDAPGITWLNVERPLQLEGLRGRLVILDFWTLGCINCMHVVPTLRRVEEGFPDEATVVGVHSPKFAAERELERVRGAIRRYGITHPVAHDPDRTLWDAYALRAWPTLVLVGPHGRIVRQIEGEPDPQAFARGIEGLLHEWRSTGELRPARAVPAAPEEGRRRYAFPSGLKRLPGAAPRFALADTGHHQIVLLDGSGTEIARYGSGRPGLVDGGPVTASFASPRGLIASEAILFVADTGNHAIRAVELATGRVSTIAGTGSRGRILTAPQPARHAALASPWDLELDGGMLFFSNAGTHQLGRLDTERGVVEPLAGRGEENLVDGPAAEALLAQPAGLALDRDGRKLYFVDSESSALRVLSLDVTPTVSTLVGSGLFVWGHANGAPEDSLLQHPQGLALLGGQVLVADSFNDALRRIDLRSGQVDDAAAGFDCRDSLCLALAEPSGLAYDEVGKRLLVADTNNHRLLAFDLEGGSYLTWSA